MDLGSLLFLLPAPCHLVGDLQDGEIQLDRRLGRLGGEVVANQRGQPMSGLRELRSLFRAAVLQVLEGLHLTYHGTHLRVGLDNGERGLDGAGTFQDGGKHVEAPFGKCSRRISYTFRNSGAFFFLQIGGQNF